MRCFIIFQLYQNVCSFITYILYLVVASKATSTGLNLGDAENSCSRKLLESRIAQLESDAKEQDLKAQQILANVQARFNSVQAKYETHIADLETQVLR